MFSVIMETFEVMQQSLVLWVFPLSLVVSCDVLRFTGIGSINEGLSKI